MDGTGQEDDFFAGWKVFVTVTTVKKKDIARLFERYGPAVYRRARYLLANHEDAEEATQEVFVRAIQSLDKFEGRASVYTWLNRITTNYCLNRLRDGRRRKELWQRHMEPLPECFADMAGAEQIVTIRRLLAEADEECARAAVYVIIDGMSHAEAAEILGVSRRTVGNLIDRFTRWARERLRRDEAGDTRR